MIGYNVLVCFVFGQFLCEQKTDQKRNIANFLRVLKLFFKPKFCFVSFFRFAEIHQNTHTTFVSFLLIISTACVMSLFVCIIYRPTNRSIDRPTRVNRIKQKKKTRKKNITMIRDYPINNNNSENINKTKWFFI